MSKRSQLKKFIPLSVLLHASALVAAGIIGAPLLNHVPETTSGIEMGIGDSEEQQTIGLDVIATSGNQSNDMANTSTSLEDSNISNAESVEPETKNSDVAIESQMPPKQEAPTAKVLPVAKSINKPEPVPTNVRSQTVTSEELNLPPVQSLTSQEELVTTETPSTQLNDTLADTSMPEAKDIKPISEVAETQNPVSPELTPPPESIETTQISTTSQTTEIAKDISDSNKSAAQPASIQQEEPSSNPSTAQGLGAGNNGVNQESQGLAGAATGIKSLDQISQRPGNPKPRYDRAERLRGDQGTVVFKAYIGNDGLPKRIVKITSSGHANLDLKAQNSLAKWRFESGQEGWVEVPFKWELKGEAENAGGTLRRSAYSGPEGL